MSISFISTLSKEPHPKSSLQRHYDVRGLLSCPIKRFNFSSHHLMIFMFTSCHLDNGCQRFDASYRVYFHIYHIILEVCFHIQHPNGKGLALLLYHVASSCDCERQRLISCPIILTVIMLHIVDFNDFFMSKSYHYDTRVCVAQVSNASMNDILMFNMSIYHSLPCSALYIKHADCFHDGI